MSGLSRKERLKIHDISVRLHKNKGFNPYKIVKIINRKYGVNFCVRNIYNWINKRSIPFPPEPSHSLLNDLYSKNRFSMFQIAKRLKISKTSVKRYLRKYKIKIRSPKEGQRLRLQQDGKFGGYIKEKLNDKQTQFLIGTLLGDGTLYFGKRNTNASLKIQHSEKDEDYLKFKLSIINNFVKGKTIREKNFNKKTKRYYSSQVFITVTHPEFTKFYRLFYKKGRKTVTNEIFNNLTPFGLAIWIMDDGYYDKVGKYIELYTMNCTYREHLLFPNWFKRKYEILPKIVYHKQSKKYYLRFNLLDTQKLVNIIKPYIIQSMRRKIGLEIKKEISPFFEVCEVRG